MQDLLPDLFDQSPHALTLLPKAFHCYGARQVIAAPVQTVSCYRDNSKVAEQLKLPGQGRVLLVDGQGAMDRSLLGDNLAANAISNGWAGVVVLGPIRDLATIAGMALPVYALGACPIKTEKRDMGEVGIPLAIEGIRIKPGDYLYADLNGVAVSGEALSLPAAD